MRSELVNEITSTRVSNWDQLKHKDFEDYEWYTDVSRYNINSKVRFYSLE